jgi:hypothetical protein
MIQKGLQKRKLASRLVFFGVNGVNTFQGLRYGVIVQIQQHYVPFVICVHCMVHHINLVVQIFSHLPLISCIDAFLQYLYAYFCHNLKRHLKFTKLAKIMEIKGKKFYKTLKLNGYP